MTNETQPSAPAEIKLIRVQAFTMILSSMSATMFNIVLSNISEEFRLTFSQVSWVSAIYALVYAIGSAVYGKLADMIPLRRLITFGLAVFFVGSFFGLLSQAYWMLLLGRLLQAAGAAVVPAAAMIIPVRYFPAERRGQALGITATGLAIGGAIGPAVSALLVSFLHWRWLFAVPLLMIVTLPFYRRYLRTEERRSGTLDWLGGTLLAGTVALLLLAVTGNGWEPAAGSAVLFALFVMRIRRASHPFVQPRLFRNRSYTTGLAMAVIVMGIGSALPFLTPLLLAGANGLAPGWIGFAMVPAAVVSALLGRRGGKLADARGTGYLFRLASALQIAGFALLSLFAGASPMFIAGLLIFGTVGQMFMQISLSHTISRTVPADQAGVGMGLLSMLNFLALAVSMGIYGAVVDRGADGAWLTLNPFGNAPVYSNIYLVLAIAHVGILLCYRYLFGGRARRPEAHESAPTR